MTAHKTKMAFFGGEPLAVPVLEELKQADLLPQLIVCNPDRPAGRKQVFTPPPTKTWAQENGIPVFQPDSLRDASSQKHLQEEAWDLFVVVAYGSIIPKTVLDIPKRGTINAHPSLLPKFRGPSPIRSTILADERKTGVTIILLDEKMDHGPIIAQEALTISTEEWPLPGSALDARLAKLGGKLLVKIIPGWLSNTLTPQEQDHNAATYTQKLTKEMGELDLQDDPYQNLLKIRAFDGWPGTYFFKDIGGTKKRIKIADAKLDPNGNLEILRVIPEGKQEMDYRTFLNSI